MDVNESIALFTGVTAIATVISAGIATIIAWKMAQPIISVMTQMDENDHLVMDLLVENIGPGIAYDVKFEVTPDLPILNIQNLSDIGLFKNGLRYFRPQQRIKTYLQWMPRDYENISKQIFDIQVTYKDWIGLKHTNSFPIDFTLFGMATLPPSPSSKIADSLEKIEQRMMPVVKLDKISVIAYTKDEHEQELQDRIRRATEKQ